MPELQFRIDDDRPHLGGYVEGGDPATYYPHLWQWFVREHGIRKVVDVGCGEGHAVRYFRDTLGLEALGVDGIAQDDPSIIEHDYTKGPLLLPPVDLAWTCEFVEHVEERYIPNYLETIQSARWLLMTFAAPGQDGYHHVNCRSEDYWLGVFAAIGFSLDPVVTVQSRVVAARNANPWNHYVKRGLALHRRR